MGRILKYAWFIFVMKITGVLPDFKFVMRMRGKLLRPCFKRCGRDFQICSNAMVLFTDRMEIGDHVYIAYGCWIHAAGGIAIDDEVMLGPYTVIVTGNHQLSDGSYRFAPTERAPVRLGRGSWMGAGTKIMPGVTVGRGSLCAAGSVVISDVPDFSVVGGVPAKILKENVNCTAIAKSHER